MACCLVGDAREFGIPDRTFHDRSSREEWRCLGLGVKLLPGVPVTRQVRMRALLHGLADRAALSHPTAVELHGLAPVSDGIIHAVVLHRAVTVLEIDGADSILEQRTRRVLRADGLTPTDGPHPVATRDGRVLHVDIAFPDQRVALECDGFIHHGDRAAFERDRARWRALREAGWTIIWVTWQRLHEQPGDLVAEVHRALATASRRMSVGDHRIVIA